MFQLSFSFCSWSASMKSQISSFLAILRYLLESHNNFYFCQINLEIRFSKYDTPYTIFFRPISEYINWTGIQTLIKETIFEEIKVIRLLIVVRVSFFSAIIVVLFIVALITCDSRHGTEKKLLRFVLAETLRSILILSRVPL